MKRYLISFILLTIAAIALVGCGGDSSSDNNVVTVTITPMTNTVAAGSSVNLTANVTGTMNKGVQWTIVEGSPGGGTLTNVKSNTVTYTAPQTAGVYHVKATSVADPGKSATATITVTADQGAVSVIVNPATAVIDVNAALNITAIVTGSENNSVTWSIVESGANVGTLTNKTPTSVTYTAPSVAGTYHVKATSVADTSKSATATITVKDKPAVISVTVNPASATLSPNEEILITATVTGTTNNAVTWNIVESGADVGALLDITDTSVIYASGLLDGTYHVKATSVADTTKSATTKITVSDMPPHPPLD